MSDLVVAGSFQDKIFAKIKESIGDLMTDDDLKRLVEAAMQDAFFKERVTTGSYGHKESKPPVLVELVDKLVRDRVDVAVKEWLEAHSAEILKLLNERLTAGATQFIASSFDYRMASAFQQFNEQLRTALAIR